MASVGDTDTELPVDVFTADAQCLFYNYKPASCQRMLDADFICRRRRPSIAALITPGTSTGNQKVFWGADEIMLPIYPSLAAAVRAHGDATILVNFASYRSAYAPSMEALTEHPSLRCVYILAEGVPERDTKRLVQAARREHKLLLGPSSVGAVHAGAFKIADAAGTIDNMIACKLYREGSVGFVSKSGGLSNEMYNILARAADGVCEGVSIGGDVFPGSTLSDHCVRFEKMERVKFIVVLGELGGRDELQLADCLRRKLITKPVCAWVSGSCASLFPQEVQFGHAGARSGSGDDESAAGKLRALRDAGAHVPTCFEDFPRVISEVYQRLLASGVCTPIDEPTPPELPATYTAGRVRRSTSIVSTICDDRGDEPTYAGVRVSELVTSDAGMGDVVSLLWFKRRLPRWATRFIEIVLVLVADHGPCVSGAHNTIVCARAGKDIVSSLASGLLTIGPRFGGAIDDSAREFKRAVDAKLEPEEFVESMKKEGKRIPGIGHRIKSADNLDARVIIMKKYAAENFSSSRYLDYALRVEKYTLQKASNLLLNVDGCIATCWLDLMESCAAFSNEEINDIVKLGYLNGLFALGRSIGLIGHSLDQQRLKQALYRHSTDDVLYC